MSAMTDVPFLAEAGGGFSFSGFQQTFHDAWSFVFPNGMLLLLCLAVAWFVGRVKIPNLSAPVNRTKEGVTSLAHFLEESNLFGSKLFPAVVLVMIVLAALNIFSVLRTAAHNVLPPQFSTRPENLYRRLVDPDLFLQVLAHEPGIGRPEDVYRKFGEHGQTMERDENSNSFYWDGEAGNWALYAGDFKLLAAVALISCLIGLRFSRWASIPRWLLATALLTTGYVYCLTKELYAREQAAFSIIHSYQKKILEGGKEPSKLMEQGLAVLDKHSDWIDTTTDSSTAWWSLNWIDMNFYTRALKLLQGGIDDSGTMHPLIDKEQFTRVRESLEWEKNRTPAPQPVAKKTE